jgi:hypothetical protein
MAGCIPISDPYDVSAAQVIPASVTGARDGSGRTTFHSGTMELRVEARNPNAHGMGWMLAGLILPMPMPPSEAKETTAAPLYLIVDLRTHSGTATFDPMAPRLTRPGSAPLAPDAYLGPGAVVGEFCAWDAKWVQVPGPRVISIGEERSCYVLAFPTTSSPDSAFVLDLNGVEMGGVALDLRGIPFAKIHAHAAQPREWRPSPPTPD